MTTIGQKRLGFVRGGMVVENKLDSKGTGKNNGNGHEILVDDDDMSLLYLRLIANGYRRSGSCLLALLTSGYPPACETNENQGGCWRAWIISLSGTGTLVMVAATAAAVCYSCCCFCCCCVFAASVLVVAAAVVVCQCGERHCRRCCCAVAVASASFSTPILLHFMEAPACYSCFLPVSLV
jgi:hypothetical protein